MHPKTGRLIVIEGTDGSGKSTQFAKLCAHLDAEGQAHHRLVFPQYQEESSALIRMYLRGDFGTNPSEVNAFAASAFYAVDRYASYKMHWEGEFKNGALFLADRYTTSNAVHQAAKLTFEARRDYITWLSDFEYTKMGLPAPTLVIYLDLPTKKAMELIGQRAEQGGSADIHETDEAYLAVCREAAIQVAEWEGWTVVSCVNEAGDLRSIEDIHEEVWQLVLPYLR
jgi:dTMP kinase